MKSRKLQSATEFMGQYSGALILLVVAISAIAIFATSQHNNTFTGSTCYISPEILCYQQIVSTNAIGTYSYVYFTNKEQTSIYLNGYNISFGGKAYQGSCNATTLAPGQSAVCSAALTNFVAIAGTQLNPVFYINYRLCNNLQCTGSLGPSVAIAGVSTVTAIANFTTSVQTNSLPSNSISPPNFDTPVTYGETDTVSGTCPSLSDTCELEVLSGSNNVAHYAQNGLPTNAPNFDGDGTWNVIGGQSSASVPSFSGSGNWVIAMDPGSIYSPNFDGHGSYHTSNSQAGGFTENQVANDTVTVYAYNGAYGTYALSSNSYTANILTTFNQGHPDYDIIFNWDKSSTAAGYLIFSSNYSAFCDMGTANTFRYNSSFYYTGGPIGGCEDGTPSEFMSSVDDNFVVYAYNTGSTGNFVLSSSSYNAVVNYTFNQANPQYNIKLNWANTGNGQGYVVFDTDTDEYCKVSTHNFTFAYNSIGGWDQMANCGDGYPSEYSSSISYDVAVYAYNVASDGTKVLSNKNYSAWINYSFDQAYPSYNAVVSWDRTSAAGYIIFWLEGGYGFYCDTGTSNSFSFNSYETWFDGSNCSEGEPEYGWATGSYTVGGGGGNLSFTICSGPGYASPSIQNCIAATNYQVKLCDNTLDKCSASLPLVVNKADPNLLVGCSYNNGRCLSSFGSKPNIQFGANISTIANQVTATAIQSIVSANSATSYYSVSNTFTNSSTWVWTSSIVPNINNIDISLSASTPVNQNYTSVSKSSTALVDVLGPISFSPAQNWACSLKSTYFWGNNGDTASVFDQMHGNEAQNLGVMNDSALLYNYSVEQPGIETHGGYAYDLVNARNDTSGIAIVNVSNYGFMGMILNTNQETTPIDFLMGSDGTMYPIYENDVYTTSNAVLVISEIGSSAAQNVITTGNDYALKAGDIHSYTYALGGSSTFFGAAIAAKSGVNYVDSVVENNYELINVFATNPASGVMAGNALVINISSDYYGEPVIATAPDNGIGYFAYGLNITEFNAANPSNVIRNITMNGQWVNSTYGIEGVAIAPGDAYAYVLDFRGNIYLLNLTSGYTEFLGSPYANYGAGDFHLGSGPLNPMLLNNTLYIAGGVYQSNAQYDESGYGRTGTQIYTFNVNSNTFGTNISDEQLPTYGTAVAPVCENQNNYYLLANEGNYGAGDTYYGGGTELTPTSAIVLKTQVIESSYNYNTTAPQALPYSGDFNKNFPNVGSSDTGNGVTDGWWAVTNNPDAPEENFCSSYDEFDSEDLGYAGYTYATTYNSNQSQFEPYTSNPEQYFVSPNNSTFYGAGVFYGFSNTASDDYGTGGEAISAFIAINSTTGNTVNWAPYSFAQPEEGVDQYYDYVPTYFNGYNTVYYGTKNIFPAYTTGTYHFSCLEFGSDGLGLYEQTAFCGYMFWQYNLVSLSTTAAPTLFVNFTQSLSALGSGYQWLYPETPFSGTSCDGYSDPQGYFINDYTYAGHSSTSINYVVYLNAYVHSFSDYSSPSVGPSGYYIISINRAGSSSFTAITGLPYNSSSDISNFVPVVSATYNPSSGHTYLIGTNPVTLSCMLYDVASNGAMSSDIAIPESNCESEAGGSSVNPNGQNQIPILLADNQNLLLAADDNNGNMTVYNTVSKTLINEGGNYEFEYGLVSGPRFVTSNNNFLYVGGREYSIYDILHGRTQMSQITSYGYSAIGMTPGGKMPVV